MVRLGKCAIIFYKYTTYNKDWGNRMKKILFASSEAVPFIKTGGLADVVGSLPKYFPKNEYDVRVVVPKYMCMDRKYTEEMKLVTECQVQLNWRTQYAGVYERKEDGVTFLFH